MDGKSLWLMDDDGRMKFKPKRVTFNTNSIWAFDQALVHGYGIGVLPMCGLINRDLGLVRVLPDIVHMESLSQRRNSLSAFYRVIRNHV